MFAYLNRNYRHLSAIKGSVLGALILLSSAVTIQAQQLQSPESFLGFPVGADNKLAHWDQIVEYMYMAGEASDRIMVTELGKSTLGNPFIMLTITSEENMRNLYCLRLPES